MSLIFGLDTASNVQRPVKVNASGELEMTAELDTSGLAKEATLTDGTQLARCMGSEDPTDPAATQRQIHLDGSGNILVKEVGTVNVAPSNDTNSGITNDPANSFAVGLRGREDPTLASTEQFIRCDANGRLSIDVNSGVAIATIGSGGHASGQGVISLGLDGATARGLAVDANGHLQVDVLSGGGGGGSASNQYNNGGTEETLSVLAPVGPATSAVTPAVTIFDMTNYKGLQINVTTASASYFDLSVGIEFSNSATFVTTLGVAYSDIQTFNSAVDVSSNPISGQFVANVLMTPEFNAQQPQAQYARATFNHSNNAGGAISVVINAIQIPF